MERFDATGGASKASDGCSFAKISESDKDWCNGRSEQGKDALACVPKGFARTQSPWAHTDPRPTKSEWDSANAKPYKHTDDCITKSDGDSADAKQAERSLKGKGVGARRGMVRKTSLMVRMWSNPHRLDGKSIAILETVR